MFERLHGPQNIVVRLDLTDSSTNLFAVSLLNKYNVAKTDIDLADFGSTFDDVQTSILLDFMDSMQA